MQDGNQLPDDSIFLVQLPTRLPFTPPATANQTTAGEAEIKDVKAEEGKPAGGAGEEGSGSTGRKNFDDTLKKMPAGVLGKLRIHRSGR